MPSPRWTWSTRLRADGLAAVVSGAGPTVLVLADSGAVSTADLATRLPGGLGAAHPAASPTEGVRVTA